MREPEKDHEPELKPKSSNKVIKLNLRNTRNDALEVK